LSPASKSGQARTVIGKFALYGAVDDAKDIDVLWVAYDTPVDDDNADPDFVMAQIGHALLGMSRDVVVLVSSQLPVGSVRRLEIRGNFESRDPQLKVAYSLKIPLRSRRG